MAPDPLQDLREQLRATRQAAERIAGGVPPQGWASPIERDEAAADVQALVTVLQALRDSVPDELWEQVRELLALLLALLRAVLDVVVERLSAGGPRSRSAGGAAPERGPHVQDIPVV